MTPPTDLPEPPEAWHAQRPAAMFIHPVPNQQSGDDARFAYNRVEFLAKQDGVPLRLDPSTVLWLPDRARYVLSDSNHELTEAFGFRPVRAVAATTAQGRTVILTHGDDPETDGRVDYFRSDGSWRQENDAGLVAELTELTLPYPSRLADPTPQPLHDLDDRLHALPPGPNPEGEQLPLEVLEAFQWEFWPSAESRPQAFYDLNPRHANSRIDSLVSYATVAQATASQLRKGAAAALVGSGLAYAWPSSGWMTLAGGAATASWLAVRNYLDARAAGREIDEFRDSALSPRTPRARPPEPPPRQGPPRQ
ncbi:MAG TPA: hypothetical protein VHU91_08820 [Mycobacteriales bacterium]|nr:hypothetical protein [Mycobacteriales bacterium]